MGFQDWLNEQLTDPEFMSEYCEARVEFAMEDQAARSYVLNNMSNLAENCGTLRPRATRIGVQSHNVLQKV